MSEKSATAKLFYLARDQIQGAIQGIAAALSGLCPGRTGGWDFYRTARRKGIPFDQWTVLEVSRQQTPEDSDQRIRVVVGDGCKMAFASESHDTVVNVQVLEHVFEPMAMVQEMCRVLKPGGCLIMLIPQTSTLHMAPHHYYNFTRFWIREALERTGMEELEIRPLGGIWSSMASHLLYFLFQSVRFGGMTTAECKRTLSFYLLYPVMLLFVVLAFPVCMILALGDLTEEPNNHLVVARKPES